MINTVKLIHLAQVYVTSGIIRTLFVITILIKIAIWCVYSSICILKVCKSNKMFIEHHMGVIFHGTNF